MILQQTTALKRIRKVTARKQLYQGSSSAGKTFALVAKAIDRALAHKSIRIRIMSRTFPTLRDGAISDFLMIMNAENVDYFERERWNKGDNIYRFANGSMIHFIAVDDPAKLKGPRYHISYMNEADRFSRDMYKQIALRTHNEIWADWNPVRRFWGHDLVDDDDAVFMKLTYLENEALSSNAVSEIERLRDEAHLSEWHQNQWLIYGLGEIGISEGTCIKSYNKMDDDVIPEGFKLVGIGLDFGDNDPNAAVALYQYEDKYIFDELLYKNKMEIMEIYDLLKGYDCLTYADYSFPQTINQLRTFGMHNIRKCKKGPDSIKNGIDLMNHCDISVTKSSTNLIAEFLSYAHKKDRDGNFDDGKYEGPDHLVDACRYVLSKNARKRQIQVY